MLLINVLTLENKKDSQSIITVDHLFHCYLLVKVTLDNKKVNRIEQKKIAHFFGDFMWM